MIGRLGIVLALCGALTASRGAAQDPAPRDTARAARGSQLLIPLASIVIPGLGQYVHDATLPGLAFSGAALTGAALAARHELPDELLARDAEEQLGVTGLLLATGAGFLSAQDAFARALPALRREGKYEFLTNYEPMPALLTAPFDPQFLGRWTTWVHLAYTGVVVAVVLGEREPGVDYEPFKTRDAAFVTGLSYFAGVGEEAAFRGWLFPVFHQSFGERFWLSNGLQAAIFGGLHPQAEEFALVIATWAFYEGWLTRRNGWSVRESIFHHFWYDVAIATATMLTDERRTVAIAFPTIRF